MKFPFWTILAVANVAIWVGIGIGDVGQLKEPGVYSAYLPFAILTFFGSATVLGFMAGREHK